MNPSKLSDAELWEAMAANSDAITQIARYQAAIAKGSVNPEVRANLLSSDMVMLANLQPEHDAYLAELKRRYCS